MAQRSGRPEIGKARDRWVRRREVSLSNWVRRREDIGCDGERSLSQIGSTGLSRGIVEAVVRDTGGDRIFRRSEATMENRRQMRIVEAVARD
ncbi:hypothetical protein ISN44_As12g037400 [Arabidopsis suecica]|uniref:Uncharacterized protein n=1 Tax=Arabidopsis suecica TaxID=45249 RepID=A0A8T1YRZ5_ARASU|nr:hypothetical protein ISN44_As12g037400 [Arabidopsis suecica]